MTAPVATPEYAPAQPPGPTLRTAGPRRRGVPLSVPLAVLAVALAGCGGSAQVGEDEAAEAATPPASAPTPAVSPEVALAEVPEPSEATAESSSGADVLPDRHVEASFSLTSEVGYSAEASVVLDFEPAVSDITLAPPGETDVSQEFGGSIVLSNTTPGRNLPLDNEQMSVAGFWPEDATICAVFGQLVTAEDGSSEGLCFVALAPTNFDSTGEQARLSGAGLPDGDSLTMRLVYSPGIGQGTEEQARTPSFRVPEDVADGLVQDLNEGPEALVLISGGPWDDLGSCAGFDNIVWSSTGDDPCA